MEKGLYVVRDILGNRVNYIYWDPQEDPDRATREGVALVFDQPSPFPPLRAEPGPLVVPDSDFA